jgi:hypothetical protein
MTKETLTISKVIKILFSIYLAGSLFYATIHLLGFGWFQTSTSASSSLMNSQPLSQRSASVSVNQLQQKYHSQQTVAWTNAEGNYALILEAKLYI